MKIALGSSFVSIALCLSWGAYAYGQNSLGNTFEEIQNRSSLLGKLDTPRHTLKNNGVQFFSTYFSTEAANVSGGLKRTNGYTQTLSFGAHIDLGKIAGIKGSSFTILTSGRTGSVPLSKGAIGNEINVQGNVTGGNSYRMVYLAYKQLFANNKLELQIGYSPMGDAFGSDYFGPYPGIVYFESSSFSLHPATDYLDSGFLSYPLASWGGYLRGYFADQSYVEVGAWEVNPTNILPQNGFNFSINGATGVEIPVDIRVTRSFGKSHLLGVYEIGGFYDTSPAKDIANSAVAVHGKLGGYLQAYQMLYRDPYDKERTLSAFVQVAGAAAKTSVMPAFYAAGFVKQGTFPGRDEDVMGFGAYAAMANSRVIDKEQKILNPDGGFPLQLGEYGVDASYTIRAAKWLYVSPNVEYIINPGAFSFKHTPNATVVGVNFVAQILG